jgi:hypothetical protein
MEAIKFHVEGLPPKKNGANSMWGSPLESERLVKLRKAALTAMKGRPPLKSDIRLTVTVCVGAKNDRSVGDLDTFVTGVCDGLMRCAPRSKRYLEVWGKIENHDIRPDIPIAIDDDSQVIDIQAIKTINTTERQHYDITLE